MFFTRLFLVFLELGEKGNASSATSSQHGEEEYAMICHYRTSSTDETSLVETAVYCIGLCICLVSNIVISILLFSDVILR